LHSILAGYRLNKVEFDKNRYNELDSLEINFLTDKLKQLNPDLHNTTDLLIKDRIIRAIMIAEKNRFEGIENRVEINSLTIGISLEREKVKERITNRLKMRLENGMIEEVQKLIDRGITYDKLDFFGLEYKFIGKYLHGSISYEEMFEQLNRGIHNFAKRQMTWFRKMEREGIKINWIEGADYYQAEKIVLEKYSAQ